MKITGIALGVMFCCALVAENAHGAAILGLRNTGVKADGTLYANDAVTDNNYSLVSSPYGTPTPTARTAAGGFPIGPWIGDNTTSTWITPTTADNHADGLYHYRMTFDLTNYILSTVSIVGQWTTDNDAVMKLNGSQISTTGYTGFSAWTGFSLGTAFIQGINTLDFLVTNGVQATGNPTGLRVEFTSNGDLIPGGSQAVPEPGALGLWGIGALGLIVAGRKRRLLKLAA
jgi:hypothetical protein